MIVEIAIVFTILGYIVYVILSIRRGATRKKKNALANLEKLYQRHHNQAAKEGAATRQQEAPQQLDGKTASESPQAWRPRILSFYDEYLLPYINVLDHNSFLSPVERLLTILDQHGDSPSVVHSQSDHECQSLSKIGNTYDALAKITLLEHAINVTRELIEAIKKQKTSLPAVRSSPLSETITFPKRMLPRPDFYARPTARQETSRHNPCPKRHMSRFRLPMQKTTGHSLRNPTGKRKAGRKPWTCPGWTKGNFSP